MNDEGLRVSSFASRCIAGKGALVLRTAKDRRALSSLQPGQQASLCRRARHDTSTGIVAWRAVQGLGSKAIGNRWRDRDILYSKYC